MASVNTQTHTRAHRFETACCLRRGQVPTGDGFYEPMGIGYLELPAFVDSEATDFLLFWDLARDFIQQARQQDGARVRRGGDEGR